MINEETNSRTVVKVRPQRSIKRHKTLDSTEKDNVVKHVQERRDSDLMKRRESIQKEETEQFEFQSKVIYLSITINNFDLRPENYVLITNCFHFE